MIDSSGSSCAPVRSHDRKVCVDFLFKTNLTINCIQSHSMNFGPHIGCLQTELFFLKYYGHIGSCKNPDVDAAKYRFMYMKSIFTIWDPCVLHEHLFQTLLLLLFFVKGIKWIMSKLTSTICYSYISCLVLCHEYNCWIILPLGKMDTSNGDYFTILYS